MLKFYFRFVNHLGLMDEEQYDDLETVFALCKLSNQLNISFEVEAVLVGKTGETLIV